MQTTAWKSPGWPRPSLVQGKRRHQQSSQQVHMKASLENLGILVQTKHTCLLSDRQQTTSTPPIPSHLIAYGTRTTQNPFSLGAKRTSHTKSQHFTRPATTQLRSHCLGSGELLLLVTPSRDIRFLAWQGYFYLYIVQM